MFITIDTHCPLCKFDFFSVLNGKEIDFNNINTENNNLNNIKTEECFINNLPSHRSNVINIKNTIKKILFSNPTIIRNKGNESNDENENEVTTSKLKLSNKRNDKINFYSDCEKRTIKSERNENNNINEI